MKNKNINTEDNIKEKYKILKTHLKELDDIITLHEKDLSKDLDSIYINALIYKINEDINKYISDYNIKINYLMDLDNFKNRINFIFRQKLLGKNKISKELLKIKEKIDDNKKNNILFGNVKINNIKPETSLSFYDKIKLLFK